MKWRGGRRSTNVEDRRGTAATGSRVGGSRTRTMGGGIGGMGLILLVVVFLTGGDPMQMLSQLMSDGGGQVQQTRTCLLYTSPSPRDRG